MNGQRTVSNVAVHAMTAAADEPRANPQSKSALPTLHIIGAETPPGSRPLQGLTRAHVAARFERALASADGVTGAHCVHELWMRGEMSINIERALERLWARAAVSVPEWLPMRYIEWLPTVYEVALRCNSSAKGRSNIYLVLLDYQDRDGRYGVYVGMSEV